MVCIYKITSPSGKIYIGQTWNFPKRIYHYRRPVSCKGQPGVSRSIAKYGYENHLFEAIYILPEDISQLVLDEYEQFYIIQFRESGAKMLNMRDGGSGGKMGPEAIEKIKIKRKNQAPPTLGFKHREETKVKMAKIMAGRPMPKAALDRAADMRRGKPLSEETKAKLKKAKAEYNHWNGRKHTEESRKKQSLKKLGNKINNKRVQRLDTGEIFASAIDAAKSIGITKHAFWRRMTAGCKKGPQFNYLPKSFTTS